MLSQAGVEIQWDIPYSITEGDSVQTGAVFAVSTEAVATSVHISSSLPALTITPASFILSNEMTSIAIALLDDELAENDRTAQLLLTNDDGEVLAISDLILLHDDDFLPSFSSQLSDWPHTGVFTPASTCGECHRASAENATPGVLRSPLETPTQDISPITGWQHTVMAHGLSDPYFRANLEHEVHRFPHLAGTIEDTCLSCHSPMAYTYAHHTTINLTFDDSCNTAGCYRLGTAMEDPLAREAVSCTLCHQITDAIRAIPTPNSGDFVIPDAISPEIFGPYSDPVTAPMKNQTAYTPVHSDHMTDSAICGVCHELYTPTIDRETDMPNGRYFPEQTPYTEWSLSQFGESGSQPKSCQSCHMPVVEDDYLTRLAVKPNGTVNEHWPERPNYHQHQFAGGNSWLLEVLGNFQAELGLTQVSSIAGFSQKATETREFLTQSAALNVEVMPPQGDELTLTVTISNLSGHKLPTGYPSRRVWLGLQVFDVNETEIFASGIPDEQGRLTIDAQLTRDECVKEADSPPTATCYRPHINTVTAEDHVPIYEMVMGDTRGEITHTLLHADTRLKDNRLPPMGFPSDGLPSTVTIVGAEHDSDFHHDASGQDTVHYRLNNLAGAAKVTATLYYQSIRPDFIEAMYGDSTAINHFRSIVATIPPEAVVIDQKTLPIP